MWYTLVWSLQRSKYLRLFFKTLFFKWCNFREYFCRYYYVFVLPTRNTFDFHFNNYYWCSIRMSRKMNFKVIKSIKKKQIKVKKLQKKISSSSSWSSYRTASMTSRSSDESKGRRVFGSLLRRHTSFGAPDTHRGSTVTANNTNNTTTSNTQDQND